MSPPDQDASVLWMRQIAQGDERALERLYNRWSGPLLNFLYGMCRNRATAEDLVQGVFLKVWRAAPRYKPLAKFSTWLFQIARNHWLNERDKIMRRIRPTSLDAPRGPGGEGMRLDQTVEGESPSPTHEALSRELGRRIEEAVARLPEKLRMVWVLGGAQGLPYREVAAILEIPVGTVKSRMFQAVRALRVDLEPYVGSG
jgi:RNA polymerase sigma-70 factor (ECF subfamily)